MTLTPEQRRYGAFAWHVYWGLVEVCSERSPGFVDVIPAERPTGMRWEHTPVRYLSRPTALARELLMVK